jgi:hypothetical protein
MERHETKTKKRKKKHRPKKHRLGAWWKTQEPKKQQRA